MNFKEDYQIKEFEKLNINEKRFIQDKRQKKISILILIIIILFIIIIICCMFFFSKLEKRINHIIKFKYIEKDINKEIIKRLDFVINKLKFIKQESESNKKLDNYNNNNIYYMLSIKEVLGYNKIRIGNNNDGGYILLNDLKNIKIGYSFGISREISFDKGLADKNIDVFMYDHTINKLPFENPKFHWKKIGLTGRNNNDNMKTLPDLIEENGHSNEKNKVWSIFK
jgi:hypothetical protein